MTSNSNFLVKSKYYFQFYNKGGELWKCRKNASYTSDFCCLDHLKFSCQYFKFIFEQFSVDQLSNRWKIHKKVSNDFFLNLSKMLRQFVFNFCLYFCFGLNFENIDFIDRNMIWLRIAKNSFQKIKRFKQKYFFVISTLQKMSILM